MPNGYLAEVFVSFQGEGSLVGRRQLFLRLAGCNLRCRYCDTPDSLERVPSFWVHTTGSPSVERKNPVSAAALLDESMRLLAGEGPVDGVAITGGEPLGQADFLAELLRSEHLPRPRVLETNGMLPERLMTVLPNVDVVSMDIKLPSNTGEPAFWQAHERFLSLARGKVYVKLLVDAETDPTEIDRAAEIVQTVAPESQVFLQPITIAAGGAVAAPVLTRAYRILRQRLENVRLLPQTHKMLALR